MNCLSFVNSVQIRVFGNFPETAWWAFKDDRRLFIILWNFFVLEKNRLATWTGRQAMHVFQPNF